MFSGLTTNSEMGPENLPYPPRHRKSARLASWIALRGNERSPRVFSRLSANFEMGPEAPFTTRREIRNGSGESPVPATISETGPDGLPDRPRRKLGESTAFLPALSEIRNGSRSFSRTRQETVGNPEVFLTALHENRNEPGSNFRGAQQDRGGRGGRLRFPRFDGHLENVG